MGGLWSVGPAAATALAAASRSGCAAAAFAADSFGATDEFCYNVVENPVEAHEFQATILNLLGIDHTRLTYHFQGRDFRLTEVAGARCFTAFWPELRRHSRCRSFLSTALITVKAASTGRAAMRAMRSSSG
jgi:hypothetical protein